MLCILCGLCGCANSNQAEKDEYVPEGIEMSHGRVEKNAIIEYEDGWYYKMCIQFNKKDPNSSAIQGNYEEKDAVIGLMAYNLKHQEMEGCYIPIKEDGKIIETGGKAEFPSFASCQEYADEVGELNVYLMNQQLMREITLEDLSGIELEKIKKERVVELYNKAWNHEPESFGRFGLLRSSLLKQVKLEDGTVLQVGYLSDYGKIAVVRFEVIDADGNYASDGNAKEEWQMQWYENLKQLSKQIEDTQVWEIGDLVWENPEVMNETITEYVTILMKRIYANEW